MHISNLTIALMAAAIGDLFDCSGFCTPDMLESWIADHPGCGLLAEHASNSQLYAKAVAMAVGDLPEGLE